MRRVLTEEAQFICYVLIKEFRYTQKEVGDALHFCQSTISKNEKYFYLDIGKYLNGEHKAFYESRKNELKGQIDFIKKIIEFQKNKKYCEENNIPHFTYLTISDEEYGYIKKYLY